MRAFRKTREICRRKIVGFSAVCLALLMFSGCENSPSIHHDRLLKWSQPPLVQYRKKAAMYVMQQNGEAWAISTSELTVTETAFAYSGEKILDHGFLVYPGKIEAANIQEAIRICARTKGAVFKSSTLASNP